MVADDETGSDSGDDDASADEGDRPDSDEGDRPDNEEDDRPEADGESRRDGEPSDTMRERAGENRVKLWFLLDANRWFVAFIPIVVSLVAMLTFGILDPAPLVAAIVSGDPIETLFQAFVTATITGVTLVVSINSLVLSQELGPLGDQRDRMEGAMSFRADVEEDLDVPAAPPEPSAFLRALIDAVQNRANDLQEAAKGQAETEDRVSAYVEGLISHAGEVSDELEDEQFGTFDVLFAALDFNYSWKIYEARRLRNEFRDSLNDEARDALDNVVNTLTYFGPAREHFKTLYFQWELINLSRAMLYAAVPTLVISSSAILFLDNPGSITGSTAGVHNLVIVVSLAASLSLLPFGILLSYMLRIATVAKRTLSIGPFILRSASRSEDLDWE
ncbi:hypothetical protein SAMN04487947_2511 [Halogeometricum rufum]|uniref:Uncharacterized protein n=1 Tax=Halogeometricum rufum TaxID=553469 RepID=A0A1I6HU79_9EURY|nr:hypothetical protein [Halogeometricum rufum]SFR58015.1 hypothetical protein SAMN04487947_2511 [Halogeometricum rufum]